MKMKSFCSSEAPGDDVAAKRAKGICVCVYVYSDHMCVQLSNVPWDDFAAKWAKGKNFWLTIGQKTWEIPYSSWSVLLCACL
jgi:hypothetical protein